MKVIYNDFIPFSGYKCINLFGVLFAKNGAKIDEITINHESIHTAQMKELLYIPFYILYCLEYLKNLIKYRKSHDAYKNISFEREAYWNQRNPSYLRERKHFGQWRR